MTRALRLHEDANRELGDAAEYYDSESPGLGSGFVDEIEAGFSKILEHPQVAAEVREGIRKLVLARFPYSIVYQVTDRVIGSWRSLTNGSVRSTGVAAASRVCRTSASSGRRSRYPDLSA